MITQERLPALRRRTPPAHHILGNAGLSDIDPELEQFAVDTGRAPQRIGDAHLPDYLSDLSWHRWTAQTTPGLPAPKQSETCTVPSDHRLGSNDGERVAGLRKQLADPTQSDLVDGQK